MYAIVGPTAAGKTSLAITVAERLDAEIVSCDSMQLYRGLDVGTAKPTPAERAAVPHHLVDVIDPPEVYSAARYVADADAAIAGIVARGRRVLIVGGTGLYLRALRFGLFEAPPRDDTLRARLYAEERARPGSLHLNLGSKDPASAARIAPADLVRIVRALEVHELTGVTLSQHHAQHQPIARHPIEVMLLNPPPDVLQSRIIARVDVMLAGGLVEETRRVRTRWGGELQAMRAVGYHEVCQVLDGELRASELAPAIIRSTRHYARRQRTWFKKEAGARRFATADELSRAIDAGCRR